MLPGQADFLGNIYAFGAMLSFTIAHLALIRLRFKDPDAERPYRGPGNLRIGAAATSRCSRSSGGIGTGLSFVVVTVAAPRRRASPASAGWRSAAPSTSSTAAARGST